MALIEISDENVRRLQSFGEAWKDTSDSLLGELLDAAEAGIVYSKSANKNGTGPLELKTVEDYDDLLHTYITSASFDGIALPKTNWNDFHRYVHTKAFEKVGSVAELKRVTQSRLNEGKYELEGFKYIKEINVSIPGANASTAAKNILHMAKELGVAVEIKFEWRNNPKAAHPGQEGMISWKP